MKMTGHVDHRFVTMMRQHHQGGIDMARIEVQSGKNPCAKEFARRIVDTQEKDIRQFDG